MPPVTAHFSSSFNNHKPNLYCFTWSGFIMTSWSCTKLNRYLKKLIILGAQMMFIGSGLIEHAIILQKAFV